MTSSYFDCIQHWRWTDSEKLLHIILSMNICLNSLWNDKYFYILTTRILPLWLVWYLSNSLASSGEHFLTLHVYYLACQYLAYYRVSGSFYSLLGTRMADVRTYNNRMFSATQRCCDERILCYIWEFFAAFSLHSSILLYFCLRIFNLILLIINHICILE